MAEILSPGVYVIEESSGAKPISGVSTSTGAFVGIAERGPLNEAMLVTSFSQYMDEFGGFIKDGVLAYAVYQFFNEGGARCFVTRIAAGAATASVEVPSEGENTSVSKITAKTPGSWGGNIVIAIREGSVTGTFKIIVKKFVKTVDGEPVYQDLEVFDNLTVATVEDTVNDSSKYVEFALSSDNASPKLLEATDDNPNALFFLAFADGVTDADGISGINQATFIGDDSSRKGLNSFNVIDEVNIIAMPDVAYLASKRADDENAFLGDTTKAAMNYCELRGDCFYIADSPYEATPLDVKSYKSKVVSSYGALYYPWISMMHPATGRTLFLPPSGIIAGIYAKTDINIGVHKAPAGQATGILKSVSGIKRQVTKGEHDLLNPIGINVIRSFTASGITVWGARTTSSDSEWQYVNVRRLFLYIEESIDEGTQWVVFEPNSQELWGRVKSIITAFLANVWRSGALFGNTQDEAFYVKVDEENNPESERNLGRLNIEIGIAPVKPAEFVVIRISQKVANS